MKIKMKTKMKMKKALIASMVAASLISAGCVSSTANPVPIAQVGDDTKSCDGIANEMQQMNNAQLTAEGDKNSQVGGNVALGVAGVIFFPLWFFMDTSNAHTVEENAAKARYQRLQQMAIDRKCSSVPVYVSPNQDQPQTGTGSSNTNSSGNVERIQIKNQTSTNLPTTSASKMSLEEASDKCKKLGIAVATEQFGNCVLTLTK